MIAWFSLIPVATFHWYWDDGMITGVLRGPHGPMGPWHIEGQPADQCALQAVDEKVGHGQTGHARLQQAAPPEQWGAACRGGNASTTRSKQRKIGKKVANTEANHVSRSTQKSLPKSITIVPKLVPNEPWPEPFFQVTELILRGARHGRSCCRLRLRRLRCLRRLRSGSGTGRVVHQEKDQEADDGRAEASIATWFLLTQFGLLLYWTPFLIKILKS